MPKDFPANGLFTPKTDYVDQLPLNTDERQELRENTTQALDALHKKLKGDFEGNKITGTIKTFDKGYGLRIRDDNGNRIGTVYRGEEVKIIGRKKGAEIESGIKKNFVKIQVYDNRGKIDKARSGWVAEDFVEINKQSIDSLITGLEKKVDKGGGRVPSDAKKPEKVTEVPPEKKPESQSGVLPNGQEIQWSIVIPSSADVVGALKKIQSKNGKKTESEAEAEAEAKRIKEAAEAKTKAEAEAESETEAKRIKEAAEAKTKAEAEAKRIKEAAEAKTKAEAEAKRIKEAAEAKTKAEAEAESETEAKRTAEAEAKKEANNSIGTILNKKTIEILKSLSPNGKIAYERMIERARDKNCNFIIADKNKGSLFLFNKFGQGLTRMNALYGRHKGDEIPESAWTKGPDELSNDEKVTPAGIFVLGAMEWSKYLGSSELTLGEDWDDDGEAEFPGDIAIHPVYLGNDGEKRLDRLNTGTPKDNNISYGCINVLKADFDEWIYTCFGGSGGLIAVLPNNNKNINLYIPPYKNPEDSVATN